MSSEEEIEAEVSAVPVPGNETKVEASGQLSHPELVSRASQTVASLLADPFLSDLPRDVTPEEVSSLVALEQGRAITVYVKRFDQELIRKSTIS